MDPRNVDFLIDMHLSLCSPATFGAHGKEDIFFSTLHQQVKNLSYLQDPSCVKVIVNRKNNAMLFSRNVLPWNKDGKVRNNIKYYSCTGVYAYNRGRLEQYNILQDTEHQLEEDVEQLKVLDYGYVIKSFECPFFNETSINTSADYDRLRKKYEGTKG